MKIILCIWVLFSLVTGCSADSSILKSTESKDRTTTAIENRNEIAFLPNESEPFTGIFEEYYSNGKIKFKKNYKDGRENGLTTRWHENGQKMSETNYKDGKENGLQTVWDGNGYKKFETNYKDGKENGLKISWYENGQKSIETNYKDGKENGLQTVWDENGLKLGESKCIDGDCKKKSLEDETEQKTSEPKQKIISRCRTQMGEHGAAMVKACVDQDLEAFQALAIGSYLEKHKDILTRCLGQMGEHGYAMVKACADQDIEAEDALGKY